MQRSLGVSWCTALVMFASPASGGCSEASEAAPATAVVPSSPPRPEPADELERTLRAREAREAPSLVPFRAPVRLELAIDDRQSTTQVLPGGLCYKLLGQAGGELSNLDLVLFDDTGVLRQTDASDAPEAQLGGDRPLCPEDSQLVRVEARASRGHGPVVLQWYVSP